MKKLKKIPDLPLWASALVLALMALIPTYAYVRLIPAGLAAIFAAYALLRMLERKKARVGKVLRIVFSVILTVFFLVVGITGLCVILRGAAPAAENCEYIVVLGAKVKDSGPSASLQERIDRAYGYMKENPGTIAIVSGGKGGDEPISEAQCMFQELTAMGIDPERIWIEDRATSTWENLKFSLDIIEEKTGSRPDSIGVVSSEYHLLRVGIQARDRGLAVLGIPARTENPLRWLHYFVREVAGVWHYFILGGQYT